MADRSNGFADNFWGTFCRALRDFINAFDVNPLALVAFLIINTMLMAWFHAIFDWFRVPDWWWGVNGVLFMIVVILLGKHTAGYYIASKLNSEHGKPPIPAGTTPDPAAPEKPPGT